MCDEIEVSHVIKNVENTCANKRGIVLLVEGTRVVDDTGHNADKPSAATHLGRGGVGKLANLNKLPSRENLPVLAENTLSPNVVTGPFQFSVWTAWHGFHCSATPAVYDVVGHAVLD